MNDGLNNALWPDIQIGAFFLWISNKVQGLVVYSIVKIMVQLITQVISWIGGSTSCSSHIIFILVPKIFLCSDTLHFHFLLVPFYFVETNTISLFLLPFNWVSSTAPQNGWKVTEIFYLKVVCFWSYIEFFNSKVKSRLSLPLIKYLTAHFKAKWARLIEPCTSQHPTIKGLSDGYQPLL